MRVVAAVLLIAVGAAFSGWALTHGSGDPVEWAFVSAFGWLMCYDAWHRFFARGAEVRDPGFAARAARHIFRHRASTR